MNPAEMRRTADTLPGSAGDRLRERADVIDWILAQPKAGGSLHLFDAVGARWLATRLGEGAHLGTKAAEE